jgi:hypothetical protein
MKHSENKRTKWLTIRITAEEYAQLEALVAQTLSPSVSDYGRRVLLCKPVSIRYRNKSLDDFLSDMTQLRADLNHIGGNFNQAVHRLHGLRHLPEIQQWLLLNEQDKTRLFQLLETISTKMNEAYKQW